MRPALYQHYKGGLYLLLDLVHDSTNRGDEGQHPLFAYYRSVRRGTTHVRLYAEFVEQVEWPDGEMRDRFCTIRGPEDMPLFRERE